MFGLPQRRMSAAINTPVEYPDGYNVFNRYFIGRRAGGGYEISLLSFPVPNPTGSSINGRSSTRLARMPPANDAIFLFRSVYLDNPNAILIDSQNLATPYNREESRSNSSFYPTGANGAFLSGAYLLPASWLGRSTSSDVYLFNGSRDLPIEIIVYFNREVYALDTVRLQSVSEILASEPKGFIEKCIAFRVQTNMARILLVRTGFNGSFGTWEISSYSGGFPDGTYTINNGVVSQTPTGQNPNCQIRTQNRFVFAANESFVPTVRTGNDVKRAAVTESEINLLEKPVGEPFIDDSFIEINPIWSLFGGEVRINWLLQVSLNGGPWFTPRINGGSPFMPISNGRGDSWVRAGVNSATGMPLVSP